MTTARDEGFVEALLDLARVGTATDRSAPGGAKAEDDEPFVDDSADAPQDLDTLFRDHPIDPTPLSRGDADRDRAAEDVIGSRGSLAEDFAAYFQKLGLRHFAPDELLVMGGNNGSGPCKGKNGIPPKKKWPNMVPTILALDEVRERLGYGVRTTSVYRAPAYNECLRVTLGKKGVAKFSQHLEFRAIDFQGTRGAPADWGSVVEQVQDDWGLWTKTYSSFVHLDSRFY